MISFGGYLELCWIFSSIYAPMNAAVACLCPSCLTPPQVCMSPTLLISTVDVLPSPMIVFAVKSQSQTSELQMTRYRDLSLWETLISKLSNNATFLTASLSCFMLSNCLPTMRGLGGARGSSIET